jgi:hypothetical protein
MFDPDCVDYQQGCIFPSLPESGNSGEGSASRSKRGDPEAEKSFRELAGRTCE